MNQKQYNEITTKLIDEGFHKVGNDFRLTVYLYHYTVGDLIVETDGKNHIYLTVYFDLSKEVIETTHTYIFFTQIADKIKQTEKLIWSSNRMEEEK